MKKIEKTSLIKRVEKGLIGDMSMKRDEEEEDEDEKER